MQKKKENSLLEKLVKRNYKNELETILEDKFFDESAKGLLLEILYKIEAAYKDYETVKKYAILSKEEYIDDFIKAVGNCKSIKIVKPNSEQNKLLGNRTFIVNKEKQEIICLPIARKLLYSVSKLSKKDKIVKDKYFLLSKTISNMINAGNNINKVEPLRDFNGWSWTTVPREYESIEYNLIYQIMTMIVGTRFLESWVKNEAYIIDYVEELQNKLENFYGEKLAKDLIKSLNKLSVLMEIKINKEAIQEIKNTKAEIEEKLEKFNDKERFIIDLTEQKNMLKEKIKQIDTIINNKELLQEEYVKRNEQLALEEKIFSMRILTEIMVIEREDIFEKLEEINNLLKPQNFVEKKSELKERLEILNLAIVDDLERELKEEFRNFQFIFLECLEQKIKKAETKTEIIKLIYKFRYYSLLPYNENTNIKDCKKLQNKLNQTGEQLVQTATEKKAIITFSNNKELNYQIIKNIFEVRIISLEELYMKLTKEKEQYFVQFFDENIFEQKIKLDIEEKLSRKDLLIKLNKKVRLFE